MMFRPAEKALLALTVHHCLDDSFQTVRIKKLETHTIQSNLPFIYQAGYELKIAKFSHKFNQLKHGKY